MLGSRTVGTRLCCLGPSRSRAGNWSMVPTRVLAWVRDVTHQSSDLQTSGTVQQVCAWVCARCLLLSGRGVGLLRAERGAPATGTRVYRNTKKLYIAVYYAIREYT